MHLMRSIQYLKFPLFDYFIIILFKLTMIISFETSSGTFN